MSHSVLSFRRTSALCAAMLACAGPAFAGTYQPSTDPVFKKMLALNHDLTSYTAHIDVKTRVNILSFSLHGTLYAKGTRTKVQFDNVPGIAKSSVENQPSVSAPSTWPADYDMSIAVRDATTTIYHLVPRAADSAVTSVDVTVANATGLVQRYLWPRAADFKLDRRARQRHQFKVADDVLELSAQRRRARLRFRSLVFIA
jgi:hypothetical protein